jgi:hypothetical protein
MQPSKYPIYGYVTSTTIVMFRKKRWISKKWYRKKLRELLTRCGLLQDLCFQGDYADESSFSRAFSQKLDMAILEGEEGKIFPGTDVFSGVKIRTDLTDQYVPGLNQFAAVFLDSSSLTFGIASVTATTACFFVSH